MLVKKVTFIIAFILLCVFIAFSEEEKVFLEIDSPRIKNLDVNTPVINCPGDDTLPDNWRTASDPFKNKEYDTIPDRAGLDTLNISGSGCFSTGQFEKMREIFGKKKVIIIDLREESHGILNNMCVSWFKAENNLNNGKKQEEIIILEKSLLNKLKENKEVMIYNIIIKNNPSDSSTWDISKFPVKVQSVMTEEEFVTKYGYEYYRFTVTDENKPKDEQVDNFITFYRNLSSDRWVHFHCRAGIGRTTTFMIMYDIMKNYDKVSAEDIIKRQWLLGGASLFQIDNIDAYKIKPAEERLKFVLKFYEYCRQNGPDYKILWSDWLKSDSDKGQ
jgi:protein-tyrosine phosphatase